MSSNRPQSWRETLARAHMIYDRAAGNMEYVKEMIELFRKEMPVYLAEMEDALSKSDTEMVKRIAHKMLSPSAFFGANDLCVTLREMEKKVDLSPDEIKLLVQQVNQKCLTVFEELKKELDAIG